MIAGHGIDCIMPRDVPFPEIIDGLTSNTGVQVFRCTIIAEAKAVPALSVQTRLAGLSRKQSRPSVGRPGASPFLEIPLKHRSAADDDHQRTFSRPWSIDRATVSQVCGSHVFPITNIAHWQIADLSGTR